MDPNGIILTRREDERCPACLLTRAERDKCPVRDLKDKVYCWIEYFGEVEVKRE